jgi:hypothetical protein
LLTPEQDSPCESTTERGIVYDARDADTPIRILHNTQKINEEDSWKEINDKKRHRKSPKLIKSRKLSPARDNYWLSKHTSTYNSFDGFEEVIK